jgi:hypothetical protein
MNLKVKEQYMEYSIGGGSVKSVKLKNLNPLQYEKYYNMGFKDFFEIIDELTQDEQDHVDYIIEQDNLKKERKTMTLPNYIIEDDFFFEEDEKIDDKKNDLN